MYFLSAGQVENAVDLGESEMGSIDEESGESEFRSSDKPPWQSDAASSDEDLRKLMLEAPMMKQKKPKLETTMMKHRPLGRAWSKVILSTILILVLIQGPTSQ